MKPFWTTFYSYKGGVGRSLAVGNLAALLVKHGRRVLLIDFDLEAPGLDSFAELSSARNKPGVIEYVAEFTRTQIAPNINDFVHACELPGPLRGNLWVMPAGRKDAAYNNHLRRIKWADLYDSGIGTPFFENWKAAINRQFKPDFVFIDSRTGLTEVGGVCTTQFPDLVVMLFGLNEQNVLGVGKVAESIREADQSRVPQIHYVATPVPNLTPEKRSELTIRLDAASRHLGVKIESMIRYYAPAALSEKLFVLSDALPIPQIANDYSELLKTIINFNRGGLDFLMDQLNEALRTSDTNRINKLKTVFKRDYNDRPEGRYLLARIAISGNNIRKAITLAEESCNIDPTYEDPFQFLSLHYSRSSQPHKVVELCDNLLKHESRLSKKRLSEIHSKRGESALAAGDLKKADDSYRLCLEWTEKQKDPSASRLVSGFNAEEAHRRATGEIRLPEWKSILELFTQSGTNATSPLPIQANRLQAIHIAFALTGARKSARDALQKAQRTAESVDEIEDIFSVKDYRQVSVQEFLKTNGEMLTALDRGELWDGTKLPPTTD
jgi:tetratricopeptide (TPR) repeat protein